MDLLSKDSILSELSLFNDLNHEELELVKSRSQIVEYKKGELIYQENSPPSALYCLVLGRVMIYVNGANGRENILEYLHRGKYFGIISLLTNEPHSVTAKAINDCILLIIKKDDFDYIINKIPHLAIDLSQTLSRRLKRKDIHQKTIFESTIISVFSSYSHAGKTLYALNLALSFVKETRKSAIILDIAPFDKIHTLPAKLGINNYSIFNLTECNLNTNSAGNFIIRTNYGIDMLCFHYNSEDQLCTKELLAVISLLVNDYHYLILDLPSVMDKEVFSILNQSDVINILSGPDEVDLKRTHNLVERIKSEFSFSQDKIKIIINEYKFAKLTPIEQAHVLGHNVFATLPKIEFDSCDLMVLDRPDAEYARAIRRIARYLGGSMVGLVLGVGMGYGFCHIGVLKVIEDEKIPIDVIVGSSIGALIASLWVIGKNSRQILEIAKEFKEPKHIWGLIDLTFPWVGFIKGRKLKRFLKKHLNDKTFQDVRLPIKIIASDVKKKEPRVLDKGSLVDAIMASCAMPGVFTPFRFKEEMLFDGGIINPLPTEPLLKMGVKKIIAVNVTPSRDDILRQYEKIKENITSDIPKDIKERKWRSLIQRIKEGFKNNILDVVFSSVEMLQSEVARQEAQFADVLLHPDTTGLYWLQLYKAEEFAKRGEEEARKNISRIKQLVQE